MQHQPSETWTLAGADGTRMPDGERHMGKRLMDELEGDGRRKAHVRMIMACGMMAESKYEKDLAKLRVG